MLHFLIVLLVFVSLIVGTAVANVFISALMLGVIRTIHKSLRGHSSGF